MSFPEWAPPYLIEHYSEFYNDKEAENWKGWQGWERKRQLLKRLLTQHRMKRVWEEVTKHRQLTGNEDYDLFVYGRLFSAAANALTAYRYEKETRKEKTERYLKIANSAREFARAVNHSLLDTTPYRWYPLDAVKTILEQIRPELVEQRIVVAELNPEFLESRYPHPEHYVLENCLVAQYPGMSKIVEALAKDADELAKRAMEEPRILPYPNIEHAKRKAFIRYMAKEFVQEFGSPLYRTLATFSSVALEDEAVDENVVKDALRGWEIPTL